MSVSVPVSPENQQSFMEIPSTYYGWSLFNRFCCCMPLGVLAQSYSRKAEECIRQGDLQGAMEASDSALKLNWMATICGLIILPFAIYFIVIEII